MKNKKVAIIYARFSDRPNAADCDSCDKQIEDAITWCNANGYEVKSIHRDDAVTGGILSDTKRPGVMDAIAAVMEGDTIVVRDVSRLARDIGVMVEIERRIKGSGGRIQGIRDCVTFDTPHEQFIYRIFSAFAELQREVTRELTRAKMRKYQAEGRSMGAKPPFGKERYFDGERWMLRVNETEAVAVRMIAELSEKGFGQRKISRYLSENGFKARSNTGWSPKQIGTILKRLDEERQVQIDKNVIQGGLQATEFQKEDVGTLLD